MIESIRIQDLKPKFRLAEKSDDVHICSIRLVGLPVDFVG